jgi:hypothetical protein
VVERALRVRDRLDQGHVGAQHVAQQVLRVARGSRSENLGPHSARVEVVAELADDFDHVLDRIAPREPVGLRQQLGVGSDQDRLGGRRATVDSQEGAHNSSVRGPRRRPVRSGIAGQELVALGGRRYERRNAQPAPRRLAVGFDAAGERIGPRVETDRRALAASVLDRADRAEVLGVLRQRDQLLEWPVRQLEAALFPERRDVGAPGLDHSAHEGIRPAEQQHHRTEGLSAGQDRQVLLDDGLEERRHQLVARHALLLQSVDVRLGEDPAAPRDGVESQPLVALLAERVGGDPQLGPEIFASCPPSSITDRHSGCSFSTARLTAATSWTNLPPSCGASGPPPEPVTNRRNAPGGCSRSASILRRSSRVRSACLAWWRW